MPKTDVGPTSTDTGTPSTALQRRVPSLPAVQRTDVSVGHSGEVSVVRNPSPWPYAALGVVGFVVLGLAATERITSTVPVALAAETHSALARAGLPISPFTVDGRDVTVGGELAGDSLFPEVAELLGSVPGIRVVVREDAGRAFVRFRWTSDSLLIDGRVPEDREELFREHVDRLSASRVIDDRGRAVRFETTPEWWDGLEKVDSIPVLVQSGTLRLEESIASLEGFVASAPARGRAIVELENAFPGFRIIERLRVVQNNPGHQTLIDQALGASVVDFVTGDVQLSRDSRVALGRVAGVLLRTPDVMLEIVAHVEASGNPDVDRRRTEARARAVSQDLISRGVAANRLYPIGAGSDDPLAEGSSVRVRIQNRRVELRSVLSPPS